MSVKIEHMRYFAATSEKSILLKFCPDIPYCIISENAPYIFLGQMLF